MNRIEMKKRDMACIVLAVTVLAYIGYSNTVKAEEEFTTQVNYNNKNGDVIWSSKISDGVLSYKVEQGNDLMFKKMVDSAVLEWENAMDDVLVFEKVKGDLAKADITFDQVKTLGKAKMHNGEKRTIAGMPMILGDRDMGVIKHVDIKVVGLKNDLEMFTVVKHELGHALGLVEHNKNPKSVMYHSTAGYEQQQVMGCDADTVLEINFLIDQDYIDGKDKGKKRCHYER
jgi:predicted Zn-dependent protease